MRGGRGGRGRGRGGGRGGGGGPGARGNDVIGDTAEELGLTHMQMDAFANQPLPLYPPLQEYPPISDLSDRDGYLINKMRELSYRMTVSAHYLDNRPEKDDGIIHGNFNLRSRSREEFLSSFTELNSEEGAFFPAELFADRKALAVASGRGPMGNQTVVLNKIAGLEAKESTYTKGGDGLDKDNDDKEEPDEEEEEQWDDEEGDYEFYDVSGGEDSGGEDGGEATF